MSSPGRTNHTPGWFEWGSALLIGVALAVWVWKGLLTGGGLVGGDTYPYFFPQKIVYSEALQAGEVPLWHNLTSLGYPLLAESQAGVFYPSNQLLYRVLDVHSAYHVSLLLHYVLAYVFAWRFARCQTLSHGGALLAALVYVYGWFPARASLEWSIIGGCWLPFALWMTDRWLQTRTVGRLQTLSCALAIHLLAGHFALAFVTQLTCLAYTLLNPRHMASMSAGDTRSERRDHGVRLMCMITAIGLALILAAVQLIPTLELKSISQRGDRPTAFDPGYGHLPPMYVTQLFASWWYWHTPEMIQTRAMLKFPFLMSTSDTNPVEAHLYVGLLPLLLALCLLNRSIRQRVPPAFLRTWGLLCVFSLIYAFGWLVPILRHLPGFGFFMGPGRYTIVTTLALALLSSRVFDVVLRRKSVMVRSLLLVPIAALTLLDLQASSTPVTDAVVVQDPPLPHLPESQLRQILLKEDQRSPARLLAPGPNIANLLGVSSVPHYLGLGPAEYFSADLRLETQPRSEQDPFPHPQQRGLLRQLAVTHVLTTERVAVPSPDMELLFAGPDAFLNRVWGRGNASCYLYRLRNETDLITSDPPAISRVNSFLRSKAGIEASVTLDREAQVSIAELMTPGWVVQIDGNTMHPESLHGVKRIVTVPKGTHTIRWQYVPNSFRLGAILSLLSATGCVFGWIYSRRRRTLT